MPLRLDEKLKLNVPTGDFSQMARLAYETMRFKVLGTFEIDAKYDQERPDLRSESSRRWLGKR